MGKFLRISIVAFVFLISWFRSTGVEGRFEVVRGPCFPGSILLSESCKSCMCDLFGVQFYCLSFCRAVPFRRPPVRPRTTQRPRTTTTRPITATSRSLLSGFSLQDIIQVANATAQVQGNSTNNSTA